RQTSALFSGAWWRQEPGRTVPAGRSGPLTWPNKLELARARVGFCVIWKREVWLTSLPSLWCRPSKNSCAAAAPCDGQVPPTNHTYVVPATLQLPEGDTGCPLAPADPRQAAARLFLRDEPCHIIAQPSKSKPLRASVLSTAKATPSTGSPT